MRSLNGCVPLVLQSFALKYSPELMVRPTGMEVVKCQRETLKKIISSDTPNLKMITSRETNEFALKYKLAAI
jgi:hypothetical protein